MKVKVFAAMSETGLEKKINGFLTENKDIEIIDIKFSSNIGGLNAMIMYK